MPPPEAARRYAEHPAPEPSPDPNAAQSQAEPASPATEAWGPDAGSGNAAAWGPGAGSGDAAAWGPAEVAFGGDAAAADPNAPQPPAAQRQQGMGNAALVAANDTGQMPPPADANAVAADAAGAQGEQQRAGEEGQAGEGGEAPAAGEAAAEGGGGGGGAAAAQEPAAEQAEGAAAAAASESEAIRILGRALPSQSVEALTAARTSAESEVEADRQQLADNPPTREAPSGLQAGEEGKGEAEEAGGGEEQAPSIDDQEGAGQDPPPPDTGHEPATGPVETGASPEAIVNNAPEDPVAKVEAFRRQLWATPASDDVDTSAGERPTVALTEEANPGRYEEQATENETTLVAQRSTADAGMCVDEGVNDIYPTLPDEMLTAEFDTGETSLPEMPADPIAELSPDLLAGFNNGASAKWSEEIGGHAAGHEEAMLERRTAETEERADAERQIAEAEGLTVEEQLAARGAAHGEVAMARSDWRGELDAARTTYDGENTRVRGGLQRDVDSRVKQANTEADGHLKEGERKAEAEKVKTESEAERRKAEAERQRQEGDGFFDWIASKVKSFFAALKRGLKMLFDGLRAAVKFLIEGAKKLAAAAIELGRMAVVGLIKAAGALLEVACDVFLFAFPEARDKAKKRIREGVATAEKAVNDAAAWLREKVNKLLDLLGEALIFIIGIYEAFYTGLLGLVESLVLGMIELARGLYRLGLAASYSPGEFMGQVQEEMIGADLSQPLPFELTEAEKAQLEAQANAPVPEGGPLPDPADYGGDPAMAAAALPPEITADQVSVDPVGEFTPEKEFVSSVDWSKGDEHEFGENNAPENTLAGWQADMTGEDPAQAEELPPGGGVLLPPEPGVDGETGTEPEPEKPLTTEQRLEKEINRRPDHTCQTEKPTQQEGPAVPLKAKFGPLTAAQRGRYMLAKAWDGIKQWFSCNWGKVLLAVLAVIAVIAAIVVAAVLSGGTVLGALGAIFSVVGPALTATMIGVAIIRALGFIGDWVSKSWDGDIIGGAKGLARAVAVGAVEIIFAVLTYVTAGAFRVLAATVKGAGKAAGAAARGAANLARRGVAAAKPIVRRGAAAALKLGRRVAPKATRMVMRGGKIVVQGVRGGIGRGVKSLREFGRSLAARFRFRKFKIVRRGRWFQVYGEINPWVLLAEGKVDWVDDANVSPIGTGTTKVGSTVKVGAHGRQGVVIGSTKAQSQAVKNVEALGSDAARARLMKSLRGETPGKVKATIGSQKALEEASALVQKESGTFGKNAADWFRNPRGELVRTKAKLQQVFKKAGRSSAEKTAQARVGKSGGVAGDQGGHAVGHRFMPDQGARNMFAQAGKFNNSAWKRLENEWADWIKLKGYHVEVDMNFSNFNAAKRPGSMSVNYKVIDPATGKVVYTPPKPIKFNNLPNEVYDRVAASTM